MLICAWSALEVVGAPGSAARAIGVLTTRTYLWRPAWSDVWLFLVLPGLDGCLAERHHEDGHRFSHVHALLKDQGVPDFVDFSSKSFQIFIFLSLFLFLSFLNTVVVVFFEKKGKRKGGG